MERDTYMWYMYKVRKNPISVQDKYNNEIEEQ